MYYSMEKKDFFINREKLEYIYSEQKITNRFGEEYENNETPSVFYLNIKYEDEIYLPATIFQNKLAPSQIIIKYFRENLNLNNKKTAFLLNKDPKATWNTYNSIREKKPIRVKETSILIPLSIFKDKQLSALEALVKFLRGLGMNYAEIARMLNKDQRTIWTVHFRAKKKIELEEHGK
jgi:DNA-binding CsgD family transcriptional regulator